MANAFFDTYYKLEVIPEGDLEIYGTPGGIKTCFEEYILGSVEHTEKGLQEDSQPWLDHFHTEYLYPLSQEYHKYDGFVHACFWKNVMGEKNNFTVVHWLGYTGL